MNIYLQTPSKGYIDMSPQPANNDNNDLDFATWFASLTDQQQCEVLCSLRQEGEKLGCAIIPKTSLANQRFDLATEGQSPLTFN
jgi:hypothetical protein